MHEPLSSNAKNVIDGKAYLPKTKKNAQVEIQNLMGPVIKSNDPPRNFKPLHDEQMKGVIHLLLRKNVQYDNPFLLVRS